jgi:hypothetical protein
LLNWTEADLANASSLDVCTIKYFENGIWETTPVNGILIRHALEQAGVEFISARRCDDVGVRLRTSETTAISKCESDSVAKGIQSVVFSLVVLVADPKLFDLIHQMVFDLPLWITVL